MALNRFIGKLRFFNSYNRPVVNVSPNGGLYLNPVSVGENFNNPDIVWIERVVNILYPHVSAIGRELRHIPNIAK